MPTPEALRTYRVCPYLHRARPGEAGHPLHVPFPQGAGRLDNPEHYRVLYLSDHPAGAVAEAFGNHAVWTAGLLAGPPSLPGSARALVTYRASAWRVLDLDNSGALRERKLRPSQIVTRDRSVTQRWALAAFRERRWSGVRWWSYYDPRWGSLGLWDISRLRVESVEPLAWDHPVVVEANGVLLRPIA